MIELELVYGTTGSIYIKPEAVVAMFLDSVGVQLVLSNGSAYIVIGTLAEVKEKLFA